MSEADALGVEAAPPTRNRWGLPIALIGLTFLSTMYVGALHVDEDHSGIRSVSDFLAGWVFSVPLMGILLAHEFGHFIAGKRHGVDISPPYFIPMPFFLLGTMGAVIRMRGPIRSKNALLDVGAAGPLAGLAVAIPVLIYGLATSPVTPLPPPGAGSYFIEGRSILYLGLLYLLKGAIPAGQDIFLTPTALAGWAGLLVTMINLLPIGQLDGGHVAYALLGERQDGHSERLRKALPFLAVGVSLLYGVPSLVAGEHEDLVLGNFLAGVQWLVWAALLFLMTRMAGPKHPPTTDEPLSRRRRAVAIGTLLIFVLLFMPTWMRAQ